MDAVVGTVIPEASPAVLVCPGSLATLEVEAPALLRRISPVGEKTAGLEMAAP